MEDITAIILLLILHFSIYETLHNDKCWREKFLRVLGRFCSITQGSSNAGLVMLKVSMSA